MPPLSRIHDTEKNKERGNSGNSLIGCSFFRFSRESRPSRVTNRPLNHRRGRPSFAEKHHHHE